MQGQNNESGNDSADLNFKSSDIQQGDEGQLFVNVEGAEERAAEEAEAKAKIEAEERAKQEAEQRTRAAEEHARQVAEQKAEKARLAKEKKLAKKAAGSNGASKKKKIAIASVAAVVVLAGVAALAIFSTPKVDGDSDADPSEMHVDTERDFTARARISANEEIISKYENDPYFGKEEAYAEYDKNIESVGDDREAKTVWRNFKVDFAYNFVKNKKEAKEFYEEMCAIDNMTEKESNLCINQERIFWDDENGSN